MRERVTPLDRRAAGRRIGLRDVASVAGVSTATVSRALNSPELVSPELRTRIASVAEHLGWVPNGAARALATQRTGAIGAVFPTLTHGDFARAIQGLQQELTERGYTLLLACSEYDFDQEHRQVRKFVERGVDAIVLVGQQRHPDTVTLLRQRGVLSIDTFIYDPSRPDACIGPDNHKALHRLTSYLIGLGHRRFGVIAQSTHNNDRSRARLEGVRAALAEHSLAIHPRHFAEGRWNIAEGRALLRRILKRRPWPTAVVCGNAFLSIGAILEAAELGIVVPRDLTIVGYDDIELMAELPVPITTVRVLSDEVGRRAARYLVSQLAGRPEDVAFECEAEIVIRASSGPPPRSDP